MYNLTNYSLLFISEIKIRVLYVFLSILCVFLLCLYNFNLLLIQLLYPLDTLHLDISFKCLSFFIFNNFLWDYINLSNTNMYETDNSFYDYYPLFEINISNNYSLYVSIFFYFILLFSLPIVLYHLYLFIIPSLYYNECILFQRSLFFLFFSNLFYFFFLHSHITSFFFNLNYNQFQELYNYEFDIEFNLSDYISFSILLYIFFFLYTLYISLWFFYTDLFHLGFYIKCVFFFLLLFNTLNLFSFFMCLFFFYIFDYFFFLRSSFIKYFD